MDSRWSEPYSAVRNARRMTSNNRIMITDNCHVYMAVSRWSTWSKLFTAANFSLDRQLHFISLEHGLVRRHRSTEMIELDRLVIGCSGTARFCSIEQRFCLLRRKERRDSEMKQSDTVCKPGKGRRRVTAASKAIRPAEEITSKSWSPWKTSEPVLMYRSF